jgi:hypothetical protein
MAGDQYDNPNQEVVRADGSGPADEGDGGSVPESEAERLDAMTKAELLGEAEARGLQADAGMTKADLRALLETSEEAV